MTFQRQDLSCYQNPRPIKVRLQPFRLNLRWIEPRVKVWGACVEAFVPLRFKTKHMGLWDTFILSQGHHSTCWRLTVHAMSLGSLQIRDQTFSKGWRMYPSWSNTNINLIRPYATTTTITITIIIIIIIIILVVFTNVPTTFQIQ